LCLDSRFLGNSSCIALPSASMQSSRWSDDTVNWNDPV